MKNEKSSKHIEILSEENVLPKLKNKKNSKLKINVSKDGKIFFDIIVFNGKVIWNPTYEYLKIATRPKSYSETNVCPRCREDNNITDRSILYPGNVCIQKYNNNDTENWICAGHYHIDSEKYDPNSINNIIKSMAHRRTGDLKDHANILGDNCEELTKHLFGANRLSTENDKYNLLNDHSPILEEISVNIGGVLVDLSGKILLTKGRHFNRYNSGANGGWPFGKLQKERNKDFDFEICWCVSRDGLHVERGYMFPKNVIVCRIGINIVKDPCRKKPWYEEWRIADEGLMEEANEIWKSII